jgi:hypothetical protein
VRIHKVVNRVHKGTVYYRWVMTVSPKEVRALGWVDGQQLETVVRGSSLWIQPSVRSPPRAPRSSAKATEESLERMSVIRR